jgi:Flp pilus assembly protein TadG
MFSRLLSAICSLRSQQQGSVTVALGVALPMLIVGGGVAIDMSKFYNARTLAQSAADSAALATVHEAALAGVKDQRMTQTASAYARSALGELGQAARIAVSASPQDATLKVDITLPVQSYFGHVTGLPGTDVAVTATARLMGNAKICLLALETVKDKTMELAKNAKIRAPNCSAFINSPKPKGLSVKESARLVAKSICTAGGYEGSSINFEPMPRVDCPVVPDPLASRPPPPAGACDYTDKIEEKSGTIVLRPGVYCGGLKIGKDAVAKLDPGIYVIRGSKLVVDGKASIEGNEVGFFLQGDDAQFEFTKDATVSLTAPTTGPMAGLLFYEDRNASPKSKHKILSNNAHTLLGTIYLPRGQLFIGADKPIANRAAFTILVANQIEMLEGPELYLNADYGSTTVPVPKGLGPVSGRAQLVK